MQKQGKLKLCWMHDYDIQGSVDKCVAVVVLLGLERRGEKNETTWEMSLSEEEEQGQSLLRFNVTLIYIHRSLAASECMDDVTILIKALCALWRPKHWAEVMWLD